jgi:hypothetical protein
VLAVVAHTSEFPALLALYRLRDFLCQLRQSELIARTVPKLRNLRGERPDAIVRLVPDCGILKRKPLGAVPSTRFAFR